MRTYLSLDEDADIRELWVVPIVLALFMKFYKTSDIVCNLGEDTTNSMSSDDIPGNKLP